MQNVLSDGCTTLYSARHVLCITSVLETSLIIYTVVLLVLQSAWCVEKWTHTHTWYCGICRVAPGIVFTHKRPSFKRARHWVQKDFKKYFDDMDHNSNQKNPSFQTKILTVTYTSVQQGLRGGGGGKSCKLGLHNKKLSKIYYFNFSKNTWVQENKLNQVTGKMVLTTLAAYSTARLLNVTSMLSHSYKNINQNLTQHYTIPACKLMYVGHELQHTQVCKQLENAASSLHLVVPFHRFIYLSYLRSLSKDKS